MRLRDMALIDIPAYEASIKKLEEKVSEEKTAKDRALEVERSATEAAQKEAAIYKEESALYRANLKAVTKKPSGWCRFARILTFGIKACH